MKFLTLLIAAAAITISFTYGKNYKGAEYRTKENYTYGRFEVRFKPANREGVVSSFFTYHEISSTAEWNEIDIEAIGRYTNLVQFNTITPGQQNHVRNNYVAFNPFVDFHDYAFEWTPDYIAWFIDNEEVYRQTGDFVKSVVHEQKIMMNIWNPVYTGWVGYWNDDFLPARSYYDWVSYSSYTPGSGNTGTSGNFSFQWKDDFDSWDKNRWEKATHTFGGNQADFIQENAVLQDGYLILCLTDETNIGLSDNRKPNILWARENFDNTVTVMFSEEINKPIAETVSNYTIPGVKVISANLNEDSKSVLLHTQNYDPDIPYNIIIQNITDDESIPNKMALKAIAIIQINELFLPVKINAGGSSLGEFNSDIEWSSSTEYGYSNGSGKMWPQNIIIGGTSDGNIYKYELNGLAAYKIRVKNGTYNIKLMFAENEFNESGRRIFDVVAEGRLLKDNLDIYSEVGKNQAFDIEASIEVNDEVIDLYFPEETGNAIINGIIVDHGTTDININKSLPDDFELLQNYPNPFNNSTIIKFYLNSEQNLKLKIYDALGRNIVTENLGSLSVGEHKYEWNGNGANESSLSSGVYFYSLQGEKNFSVKKLMLLK